MLPLTNLILFAHCESVRLIMKTNNDVSLVSVNIN